MTPTHHHLWEGPFVVGFRSKDQLPKDTLWTARQVCWRCGTERNPLTGKLTKFRGRRDETTGLHPCQVQVEELEPYRWNEAHERVRAGLVALRSDGHRVSLHHPDTEDSDQGRLV